MNDKELKPCPFCGGEAKADSHFSCVWERIYGEVRCTQCGVTIRGTKTFDTYGPSYEGYATPEWASNTHKEALNSAIETWNRRADDAE